MTRFDEIYFLTFLFGIILPFVFSLYAQDSGVISVEFFSTKGFDDSTASYCDKRRFISTTCVCDGTYDSEKKCPGAVSIRNCDSLSSFLLESSLGLEEVGIPNDKQLRLSIGSEFLGYYLVNKTNPVCDDYSEVIRKEYLIGNCGIIGQNMYVTGEYHYRVNDKRFCRTSFFSELFGGKGQDMNVFTNNFLIGYLPLCCSVVLVFCLFPCCCITLNFVCYTLITQLLHLLFFAPLRSYVVFKRYKSVTNEIHSGKIDFKDTNSNNGDDDKSDSTGSDNLSGDYHDDEEPRSEENGSGLKTFLSNLDPTLLRFSCVFSCIFRFVKFWCRFPIGVNQAVVVLFVTQVRRSFFLFLGIFGILVVPSDEPSIYSGVSPASTSVQNDMNVFFACLIIFAVALWDVIIRSILLSFTFKSPLLVYLCDSVYREFFLTRSLYVVLYVCGLIIGLINMCFYPSSATGSVILLYILLCVEAVNVLSEDSFGSVNQLSKLLKNFNFLKFPVVNLKWMTIFLKDSDTILTEFVLLLSLIDCDKGNVEKYEENINYSNLSWEMIHGLSQKDLNFLKDFFLSTEDEELELSQYDEDKVDSEKEEASDLKKWMKKSSLYLGLPGLLTDIICDGQWIFKAFTTLCFYPPLSLKWVKEMCCLCCLVTWRKIKQIPIARSDNFLRREEFSIFGMRLIPETCPSEALDIDKEDFGSVDEEKVVEDFEELEEEVESDDDEEGSSETEEGSDDDSDDQ